MIYKLKSMFAKFFKSIKMNFSTLTRSKWLLPILICIFISAGSNAQDVIQDVKIQTMGEIEVRVQDVLKNNEKPVIFFTYFNSCDVCVKSLDLLFEEFKKRENYSPDGFKFKIVAVNTFIPNGGIQAIKEFALNKGWTFDIYLDPNKNIMDFLNDPEVKAPRSYVFLNKKAVYFKGGWVDKSPKKTADNLIYAAKSIGSNLVYFDKDWNYTNPNDYYYFRTVDHLDDFYVVQDRWKSGKLQMKGQYIDKELTVRQGHFIWFNSYGRPTVERDFKENIQVREKLYYPNGQLLSDIEYKDGKVYNINACFSPEGEAFDKGTIKDGTGSVIIYNDWGNKVRKYNLNNGLYEGEWIEYKGDGSISKKYKYQNSEWVEI